VYAASSPFQAPATLAMLTHVEQVDGRWHVLGGIGRVRDALERAARAVGVDVRFGTDVGRIATDDGRAVGVELADGGSERAEVVVTDVDAAHLYTDLLPRPREAAQLDEAGRSTSTFVVCAAVRGRTEGVVHHNVLFGLHDEQEHRYLTAGQLPIDPTVSACVPTVTDPTMAPPDHESWVMHVQVPAAIGIDRKLMTAAVLNRLAERGYDLRARIDFTRTLVPADFDARYRAVGGAIHGTSANGRAAALGRPANAGPVDGLYLVGGSAHPGGGIPFVAAGAKIVADLVADRHG
jgi:phytoene desaturase